MALGSQFVHTVWQGTRMRGGLHQATRATKLSRSAHRNAQHHVQNWERQASAQHMHIRRSAKGEETNKMGSFV